MSALAWAFVAALVVGFVVGFLVVALVVGGQRKPMPKPPTGNLHERMRPRPLLDAADDRLTARLHAELEDPAAVDQWLRGGRS